MKRATILFVLFLILIFTTLNADAGQGLRLYVSSLYGVQETQAAIKSGMTVKGKVTSSFTGYFLNGDIVGNDYALDLWCKAEPAGWSGTITAEFVIDKKIVANTAFQVTGTDFALYHVVVKGVDPVTAVGSEVAVMYTIETAGDASLSLDFGTHGDPQSSVVIPGYAGATDINAINNSPIPGQIELMQNYPNPFNPGTQITYALPQSEFVILKVYDLLGREVATLVNGMQPQGTHNANFDASALSGGTYFYRLRVGNNVQTRKMILAK